MTDFAIGARRRSLAPLAARALIVSARTWFAVATLGQWIFVAYIVVAYGGRALEGGLPAWNAVSANGYIPGDTLGNLALVLHIALAVVVIGGGPLQLVPQIRQRAPGFHRFLGRLYLPGVVIASLGGLYMLWARDIPGDRTMDIGMTLDAVLILVFAAMAFRHALRREIAIHRRWALRLFMVVSAVWFFRIGLMGWLVLNGGPVGFDPQTFTGPFVTVLAFAQYLIPLLILELYFRAQAGGSPAARMTMAVTLVAATGLTAFGVFGATLGMWLPHFR